MTSVVVSIALWWNLCQTLEVFRSSVSERTTHNVCWSSNNSAQ